jgi:hypothetical protein
MTESFFMAKSPGPRFENNLPTHLLMNEPKDPLMHKMKPILAACLLIASTAGATTFVVPSDRDLLHRSELIVVATAINSYSQRSPMGGIETVTPMSIEEVIKGKAPARLNIYEPGGELNGMVTVIPGVPRFESGQRALLLLRETGPDRYSVTELVLGKFRFARDLTGRDVLVRDEDEIVGWDPSGQVHREGRRDAGKFLQFVRDEARGVRAEQNYLAPVRPLSSLSVPSTGSVAATSTSAPVLAAATGFTATSYTMVIGGSMGSRWKVFPNAVTFYSGASGEPGAPGNGATAVTTGIASWDNDCSSNVNYVYGGTDSTHTGGLHTPDGRNTVLFERDLSSWGVSPFSCSGSGYSGTLGLGGITQASGTNTVGSETFVTTSEADVEMNRGLANCSLLLNSGEFNSGVAHELGHTLGFRHADQDRNSSGACTASAGLECSSSAIMTAFVTRGLNAALQQWDVHAVSSVYPGGTCSPPPPPPSCTAPAITSGPNPIPSTITAGSSSTITVTASGTAPLSYQWYIGTSGNTATQISGATGSSVQVSPTSTTNYWVRISNSCGSVNSVTATVTVTAPPPRHKVHGDYNGDGKTDPAIFRAPSNLWAIATGQNVIWGGIGDTPVPADYDGDGKTDVSVYRRSEGKWYIILSSNGNTRIVQWGGASGDIPVPADYDGDGKADIAIFRQADGKWYIILSSNGNTLIVQWGGSGGDVPVPADYDGDGKDDIAKYSPGDGMWYIIFSSNGNARLQQWGGVGGVYYDIPVPGDFDGDGKAEIAFFRQADGKWYIMNSSNGATRIVQWGGSGGDQPQPGDYDGDGKADIATFNPGARQWYIINSSNGLTVIVNLGQSGDVAVSW